MYSCCILQQNEQDIDDEINKREWLDWLEQHSEDIDFRTKDLESKKDFINGVVNKIVVKSEYDLDRNEKEVQVGHMFDIHFNMKVVNDKLIYQDESNKNLGYEIKDGQYKLKTRTHKLTRGRGTVKKKD